MEPGDFDRVVVIGLERRPGRLRQFRAELPDPWPCRPIKYVRAIDGRKCPSPDWYHPSGNGRCEQLDLSGAWGTLRSHHRVWEDALADDLENVLVFEDDAVFLSDFAAHLIEFLSILPEQWEQLYLGGQHLKAPVAGEGHGYTKAQHVARTHAYALRRPMLEAVYQRCLSSWTAADERLFHIDHVLGQMHSDWNVYCPLTWLVGQRAGQSDVCVGHYQQEQWWHDRPEFVYQP